MNDKIRVLLSEEEVAKRIKEMGEVISSDYEGRPLHLICILKGGVFFTCELAKRISLPLTLDFKTPDYSGFPGFHVCIQLWRRHRIQWNRKDRKGFG